MSGLSHLLKSAKLSEDMLERRDFAKRIYGDYYARRTSTARQLILSISKRENKSVLDSALWICNRALADGNGQCINTVIAAAVDLCEEGGTP